MGLPGCIYKFMHIYRYNNNNNQRKIDYPFDSLFENWQEHGGKLKGRVLGKQIGGKGKKM